MQNSPLPGNVENASVAKYLFLAGAALLQMAIVAPIANFCVLQKLIVPG